jgi:CMP-N,N'-diacetyllegionaminic acid synthase
MRPEVLALIPARSGSKGIQRKNIIPVAGKPLIVWTIEQALACQRITRVIVTTDDDEIAAIAKDAGAEVPFRRPSEFAGDLSPDIEVFRHAVTWLVHEEQYHCELLVHLRPTGPVRKVRLITEAIDLMLAHPEADSLRSVSRPIQSPYKMWRIEDGWLRPLLKVPGLVEPQSMPRQILPETFWQNGYVDITRPRTVLAGQMAGEKVIPFIIDEPIYEIDYPEDLSVVETVLRSFTEGYATPQKANVKRHPV